MPRFLDVLTAVLCLVLFTSSTHGWWCKGHMLVAEIARRHLKPDVADIVDHITSEMSANGPYPLTPSLVELGCWSDDIKMFGVGMMDGWHFIDIPYNPSNITIKGSPVEKANVVNVIKSFAKTLKDRQHAPVSLTGFALGQIVHSYGDIHQPLHTTSMFSPAFPNGDRGGNSVKVYANGKKISLHSLWDSICAGDGSEEPFSRPLSEDDYDRIKKFADYLENTYHFTDSQKENTDADQFAQESHQIAIQTVYNGVTNGMHLTNDYLQECKSTAESRITLGGYRLATQLNELFSANSDDVNDPKKVSWFWNRVRRARKVRRRGFY